MTTEYDDTSFEPPHTSSPTDHVLTELQLYGYRPFQDEPDPRPMPDAQIVAGAVADIFDALAGRWVTPASNPTSKTCCGRRSTSSTAPSAGSNASWTTTSRRRSAASGNRMAPKSARSSWNA